ncbi:dihydrodipicolinate synthase family protein [Agrilactobacillus yilanensis]|uniref:Dihydrodipicolinate synthase family protein n=1 Tax=Agrilactobacillus yilanensis TaxID=2485997 RepID=A0ABW4J2Q2_9LACO|nr:dihydrodipicolinate synthase family protein [Agrilactobacillus yilanensis]
MQTNYLTPVVTALDAEGHLDLQANKNIYDYLINGGVNGLLIMGSAGEFYALSMTERKQLVDLAISYAQPRIKVLLGTGCITLEDTLELSRYAEKKGAENLILMSPYYFPVPEVSLERFFGEIADTVSCNIYLYNFPDRTGYDLTPELTLKLIAAHPNIVGYKDTVSDMAHTRKLLTAVKGTYSNFEIFSGFDENFTRNILSGGEGAIGALSNIFPELFAQLINETENNNLIGIKKIQSKIDKLMSIYDVSECFIPIIKEAMIMQGVEMQSYCKSPLLQATQVQIEQIATIIESADVAEVIPN